MQTARHVVLGRVVSRAVGPHAPARLLGEGENRQAREWLLLRHAASLLLAGHEAAAVNTSPPAPSFIPFPCLALFQHLDNCYQRQWGSVKQTPAAAG